MSNDQQSAPETAKPAPKGMMVGLRTTLSAAIAAVIGGGLGWLFGKAGEQGDHILGRRVLAVFGATSAALIAAYSSLKTAERDEKAERDNMAFAQRSAVTSSSAEFEGSGRSSADAATPDARIDAAASQHDGTAVSKAAAQLSV